MDGTLTDSEPLWDLALDDVAVSLGGQLSAQQRASLVGGNLPKTVHVLREATGTTLPDAGISAAVLERVQELFSDDVPLRPGAANLLREVHAAGIPTALVTSTHRAPAQAALRVLGMHWFEVVVTGDDVDRHKPHPLPYLTAARLLGVHAGECVAVEDSVPGVTSALAAGCAVVAVPSDPAMVLPGGCARFSSLAEVDLATLISSAHTLAH
jgi:HAD superfamily hydrolase (TIGR01509 family)